MMVSKVFYTYIQQTSSMNKRVTLLSDIGILYEWLNLLEAKSCIAYEWNTAYMH